MPRRPDLPCADCGELMWRSSTSAPAGKARCLPCRRKDAKPKPPSIQRWTCERCGKPCERKSVKGQKPKWCSQACGDFAKKARPGVCEHCGAEFHGHGARYCSRECGNTARRKPKPVPRTPEQMAELWLSQRGALRVAVEDRDYPTILAEVQQRATLDADGCWIWDGSRSKDGYPTVKVAKQTIQVHRLVLEAKHQATLGSQAAHHICAVTACVNPDHLQPVTHRDNVAEMLARQSYLNRIRELEEALAHIDPDHSLLAVVAVA